jgi:hypothetical protein
MASKQATVASFIESAPPGEVGRNGLSNQLSLELTYAAFERRGWWVMSPMARITFGC